MVVFVLKVALVYCFAKWLASRGKDAKHVEKQKAKEIEELKAAVAVKEGILEDLIKEKEQLRKENEELKEQIRRLRIEKVIKEMRKEGD